MGAHVGFITQELLDNNAHGTYRALHFNLMIFDGNSTVCYFY